MWIDHLVQIKTDLTRNQMRTKFLLSCEVQDAMKTLIVSLFDQRIFYLSHLVSATNQDSSKKLMTLLDQDFIMEK